MNTRQHKNIYRKANNKFVYLAHTCVTSAREKLREHHHHHYKRHAWTIERMKQQAWLWCVCMVFFFCHVKWIDWEPHLLDRDRCLSIQTSSTWAENEQAKESVISVNFRIKLDLVGKNRFYCCFFFFPFTLYWRIDVEYFFVFLHFTKRTRFFLYFIIDLNFSCFITKCIWFG